MTHRIVGARARAEAAFHGGSYAPLEAGPEICAVLRREGAARHSLAPQPTPKRHVHAAGIGISRLGKRSHRHPSEAPQQRRAAGLLQTFPADILARFRVEAFRSQ